jgi:putative transposase
MKNASGVRVVERHDATVMPELAEELRVALTEIAGVAREGLLAMSVGLACG